MPETAEDPVQTVESQAKAVDALYIEGLAQNLIDYVSVSVGLAPKPMARAIVSIFARTEERTEVDGRHYYLVPVDVIDAVKALHARGRTE